ncbi:MAG TPA: YjgN family protein, partial [Cellvibrionaceae bacterium]
QILASHRTVLKSGVNQATGEKYLNRLSAIGVAAELAPQSVSAGSAARESAGSDYQASSAMASGAPPFTASGPAAAEGADGVPRAVPFVFTGNGFEYFKIWIVNILLSIITLGIYSAWAKVRNKRYFYGNTYLDDVSFSYTADPIKILIGRIIATVFFVIYIVAGEVSIIAGLVMGILFLIFLPWAICKSLRFNAHYSQYRNVPFRFVGRTGQAAMAFLLWPFLGIITLGLLMPWAYYEQKKFIYDHHGYGTTDFDFLATVGGYYKIFLISLAILIVGFGAVFALGMLLGPTVGIFLSMVPYLLVVAYAIVAVTNLNYNNIVLSEHRLTANWKLGPYIWLMFTNTLGIIITLGLFIPWAKVRTAHFKARFTGTILVGDIEAFADAERDAVSSLAEGVGDLFDIDVGL